MKTRIKAKWIAALRSGRYKQGKGALKRGRRFCCLGVLCDLFSKEQKVRWEKPEKDEAHTFLDVQDILPSRVMEWAGLSHRDPCIQGKSLAQRNDAGETFENLAKIIRKHL